MWSGKYRSRWTTLTYSRLSHEYEGDTLCYHSSWTEETEEDADGREEVPDDEFENNIACIAEVVGVKNTDRIGIS